MCGAWDAVATRECLWEEYGLETYAAKRKQKCNKDDKAMSWRTNWLDRKAVPRCVVCDMVLVDDGESVK